MNGKANHLSSSSSTKSKSIAPSKKTYQPPSLKSNDAEDTRSVVSTNYAPSDITNPLVFNSETEYSIISSSELFDETPISVISTIIPSDFDLYKELKRTRRELRKPNYIKPKPQPSPMEIRFNVPLKPKKLTFTQAAQTPKALLKDFLKLHGISSSSSVEETPPSRKKGKPAKKPDNMNPKGRKRRNSQDALEVQTKKKFDKLYKSEPCLKIKRRKKHIRVKRTKVSPQTSPKQELPFNNDFKIPVKHLSPMNNIKSQKALSSFTIEIFTTVEGNETSRVAVHCPRIMRDDSFMVKEFLPSKSVETFIIPGTGQKLTIQHDDPESIENDEVPLSPMVSPKLPPPSKEPVQKSHTYQHRSISPSIKQLNPQKKELRSPSIDSQSNATFFPKAQRQMINDENDMVKSARPLVRSRDFLTSTDHTSDQFHDEPKGQKAFSFKPTLADFDFTPRKKLGKSPSPSVKRNIALFLDNDDVKSHQQFRPKPKPEKRRGSEIFEIGEPLDTAFSVKPSAKSGQRTSRRNVAELKGLFHSVDHQSILDEALLILISKH